jgi:hypothetical protein
MRRGTWKPKNQKERDWLRGVQDALSLVEEFDKYVAHDYRLSDCIRLKLNLITKRHVRHNIKFITEATARMIADSAIKAFGVPRIVTPR